MQQIVTAALAPCSYVALSSAVITSHSSVVRYTYVKLVCIDIVTWEKIANCLIWVTLESIRTVDLLELQRERMPDGLVGSPQNILHFVWLILKKHAMK